MNIKTLLVLCALLTSGVVATTLFASHDTSVDPAEETVALSGFPSTTYVCHHPPGRPDKAKKIVILRSEFPEGSEGFLEFEQEVRNHLDDHEGDCFTSDSTVDCDEAEPSSPGGYGALCVE